MKRRPVVLIIAVLVIIFGGGFYFMQTSKSTQATGSSDTVKKTSHQSTTNHKMLILYYSNSGTTKTAAKEIQKQTGADLVEMTFNPTYPTSYNKLGAFAQHQIDVNARPKITNLPDLTKYDTILLGFPTWFHRPPMFVNTFFETTDLNGKRVVPFTTSASSLISESTPYLTEMAKGTGANLKIGFSANYLRSITAYLNDPV